MDVGGPRASRRTRPAGAARAEQLLGGGAGAASLPSTASVAACRLAVREGDQRQRARISRRRSRPKWSAGTRGTLGAPAGTTPPAVLPRRRLRIVALGVADLLQGHPRDEPLPGRRSQPSFTNGTRRADQRWFGASSACQKRRRQLLDQIDDLPLTVAWLRKKSSSAPARAQPRPSRPSSAQFPPP